MLPHNILKKISNETLNLYKPDYKTSNETNEWLSWNTKYVSIQNEVRTRGNADPALKPDLFDFSPYFSTQMNVS